jgi:Flp pilus assembly protein TadG
MKKTTKEASSLRRLSPLFRREEGQATFEFVLILPFFILFLLLLIDFGIMMYEYVSVSNAVREGARYGAVNCGDGSCTAADVATRVIDRSGGILSNTGEVTVGWPDGSDRGDSVVVKVTHPYKFLFFPAATIDVVSCADMRLEQTDKGTNLPSGSGCGG